MRQRRTEMADGKRSPRADDLLARVDAAVLADAISRDSGGKPRRSGSGWLVRCPNPQHHDNNPSCSVNDKGGTALWHCFSCGAGGNAITWHRLAHGERDNFAADIEALAGTLGLDGQQTQRPHRDLAAAAESRDRPTGPDTTQEPDWAARSAAERRSSVEASDLVAKFAAAKHLALGTLTVVGVHSAIRRHLCEPDCDAHNHDPDNPDGHWLDLPVVRIPMVDSESKLRGWQDVLPRRTAAHYRGQKKRTASGCRWPAVGIDKLAANPTRIMLVEGVTDWLTALEAAPRWTAVGALGAERMPETAQHIRDCCRQSGTTRPTVLIIGDGDAAGRAGADAAKETLSPAVHTVRLRPPKGMDLSDLWRSGQIQATSAWEWEHSLDAVVAAAADTTDPAFDVPTKDSPHPRGEGLHAQPAARPAACDDGVQRKPAAATHPIPEWPASETPLGVWQVEITDVGTASPRITRTTLIESHCGHTEPGGSGEWLPSPQAQRCLREWARQHPASGSGTLHLRTDGQAVYLLPDSAPSEAAA